MQTRFVMSSANKKNELVKVCAEIIEMFAVSGRWEIFPKVADWRNGLCAGERAVRLQMQTMNVAGGER